MDDIHISEEVTHDFLVKYASRWLAGQCPIVVTEIATSGEEPDVLGWKENHSILLEIKASVSDYKADFDKPFRRHPERGIGERRYFFTPKGLLNPDTLPTGWGLLELQEKRKVVKVRSSTYFGQSNARHEIGILVSTLRRIGQNPPEGVSIKAYTMPTLNRATLITNAELPETGIDDLEY